MKENDKEEIRFHSYTRLSVETCKLNSPGLWNLLFDVNYLAFNEISRVDRRRTTRKKPEITLIMQNLRKRVEHFTV